MIITKGEAHKHRFEKEVTKRVPIRKGHGGLVGFDIIKMRQCVEGKCKETQSYDLERELK